MGYAAAKAAAEKPQPVAPCGARPRSPGQRSAPGFFVGERSRWLLPSERDELTAEPPDHRPHAPPASSAADDLIAIVTRVCDPGGSVAAGVVPVSGSFSVFSGV